MCMNQNQEIVPPTENQRKKEAYDGAARLGRNTVNLAKQRTEQRLTPFVDPHRLPREDIAKLDNKEQAEISEEDIQQALESSFAIILETAAQVAEVKLPSGQVREDLESIVALGGNLKAGVKLARELGDETRQKEIILRETRKVLARRSNVSPESLQLTDEELQQRFDQMYGTALTRIGRSIEALRGYFGR